MVTDLDPSEGPPHAPKYALWFEVPAPDRRAYRRQPGQNDLPTSPARVVSGWRVVRPQPSSTLSRVRTKLFVPTISRTLTTGKIDIRKAEIGATVPDGAGWPGPGRPIQLP